VAARRGRPLSARCAAQGIRASVMDMLTKVMPAAGSQGHREAVLEEQSNRVWLRVPQSTCRFRTICFSQCATRAYGCFSRCVSSVV
jgi:hypothetical protein